MLVLLKQETLLSRDTLHIANVLCSYLWFLSLWHLRVQFRERQVQAPLKSAVLACLIFDRVFQLCQLLGSESWKILHENRNGSCLPGTTNWTISASARGRERKLDCLFYQQPTLVLHWCYTLVTGSYILWKQTTSFTCGIDTRFKR